MKKIYTSVLVFALLSGSAFAQTIGKASLKPSEKKEKTMIIKANGLENGSSEITKGTEAILWSDDFADPSTWLIEHDATATSLDWEIGVGLENGGGVPTPTILSTTADNGFAMIDSDEYGGTEGGTEVEDSWFTNVTPIDLTDNEFVVLEFESMYRKWTFEECYVVVSTNNTDWPDLDPEYDAESNPNVFRVWPGMAVQAPVSNPTVKRINISEAAGGQSSVWIRFHWTGTWGYSWFVDDVKILEQPANDVTMEFAVISHNGLGDEYGRVPVDQLQENINLGNLSTNFGYQTQTDVSSDVIIDDPDGNEIINAASDITPELFPTDTIIWDTDESTPSMVPGVYTANFRVTSAEEQDGEDFENNIITRNFEITDFVYSLDGIGVYENAVVGSMGTNSFTEGDDEFFIMTLYQLVKEQNEVYGFEILLSPTTVPGGSIIIHLLDTADVLNDDVTNPIVSSDEIIVSQENVDAGRVIVYFDEPEVLQAGSYYAAVEMYSNGGEFPIRILNDQTVPQPSLSSVIFLGGNTPPSTFTNGNASAVRLLFNILDNVAEINKEAVLNQNVPNPAIDHTSIGFELLSNQNITIRVTDILGKVVIENNLGDLNPGTYSYTLDLNNLKSGFYHYSIITEIGSISKSMQVIK